MLSNLATYGYIVLFLHSLGGGFVALMAAGVLSYMGKMDIATSIAVAFTANFIGDALLFYMGRYHKSDVMTYLHKHKRKLAKFEWEGKYYCRKCFGKRNDRLLYLAVRRMGRKRSGESSWIK